MTPYMCLENCMKQQLHQRYDKELFFGITQGTRCLCGYDYELRKSIGGKIISRHVIFYHISYVQWPRTLTVTYVTTSAALTLRQGLIFFPQNTSTLKIYYIYII